MNAETNLRETRGDKMSRPGIRSSVGVIAAVVLLLAAPAAFASAAGDGDLDPSFGGDGKVTLDVGGIVGGVDDLANAVALQPDGKIVVAGSFANFSPDTKAFALARFKPDGSLDNSFGSAGRVLTTFPNGPATATGVALQPDGKIVAAGYWDDDDGVADADFALARYDPDGALDPSFFGDGRLTIADGGADQAASSIAIAPGGSIVTAGTTSALDGHDFELVRISPAGGVFGTGINFGADDGANAVAVQPDGKIVAAGFTHESGGSTKFALARLGGGSLDPSFSGDGRVTTPLTNGNDRANALAIQPDGRILAAGFANGDFGLARYNPDGSLDQGFSGDGKLTTDFGDLADAYGVATQRDGSIIAAGELRVAVGNFDWELARYTGDGDLDPRFSGDGKLTTDFGGSDGLRAIAIQPDSRILAAGFTNPGTGDFDFALARYLGDTIPPDTLIESGPAGQTNDPTPTFSFRATEAGSTFACAIDAGSFAPCASPRTTIALADGAHTFWVRATDPAGNTDPSPAARSFTLDTTLPTTSPPPTTTPPPAAMPAAADHTPPVISHASLSHRRFRIGHLPTASAAVKRPRAPVGTRIRFRLSEDATVTMRIERRLAGRRVRRHHKTQCVKPTRRVRHRHRRCVRWRHAGTLVRALTAGPARVRFSGRIGRRKLHRGRYRLRITAVDRAGNRSEPATLRFTILGPPAHKPKEAE